MEDGSRAAFDGRGRRRAVALSWWLSAGVLACGPEEPAKSDGSGGRAIFGNGGAASGGAGASGATAFGGNAGEYPGNPRCAEVPPGTEIVIDDFEDADLLVRNEPGRSGNWSLSHDATDGSIAPDPFAPEIGGADGTDFAVHVTAEGFTQSGISLAMALLFDADGVRCPYNASAYRGIGLFVKGSGQIELGVSTVGTFGSEFGGVCKEETEVCWDSHRKAVALAPEWTYKEIEWDSLSQAGWGKSVPFDARAVMGLTFLVTPPALPVEFWLDELRFLPQTVGGG